MFKLSSEEIARAVDGELSGSAEAEGVSTDSRKIEKGNLFIALRGERFDANDFLGQAFELGAAAAIGSVCFTPPEGRAYIRVPDTKKALCDLARYYKSKFDILTVALTGSVGKTTTKDMTYHALAQKYKAYKNRGNLNNEIGLPLTVLNIPDGTEAVVLEMGMSAPGEIHNLSSVVRPDIALITNIGVAHIEKLGSRENILKAKLEILDFLRPEGTLILNGDDELLRTVKVPHKTVYFGMDSSCDFKAENISGSSFEINGVRVSLNVPGRHNIYNALGAIAAAVSAGISVEKAARGIENYHPEGLRQNIIKNEKGYTIFCDCYNANPTSMAAALSVLGSLEGTRKIAVLGDMLELGDHSYRGHFETGKEAARVKTDILITVGQNAKIIAEAAKEAGTAGIYSFDSNAEAAEYLKSILRPGDAVLIKGSRAMRMEEILSALDEE